MCKIGGFINIHQNLSAINLLESIVKLFYPLLEVGFEVKNRECREKNLKTYQLKRNLALIYNVGTVLFKYQDYQMIEKIMLT